MAATHSPAHLDSQALDTELGRRRHDRQLSIGARESTDNAPATPTTQRKRQERHPDYIIGHATEALEEGPSVKAFLTRGNAYVKKGERHACTHTHTCISMPASAWSCSHALIHTLTHTHMHPYTCTLTHAFTLLPYCYLAEQWQHAHADFSAALDLNPNNPGELKCKDPCRDGRRTNAHARTQ